MSKPRVTFERFEALDCSELTVRTQDDCGVIHAISICGNNFGHCQSRLIGKLDEEIEIRRELRAAVVEFKPEEEAAE